MAYGQTGTGKTYTLGRLGKDDTSERGIMARALEDILSNISPAIDSVEISYLQVLFCAASRLCSYLNLMLRVTIGTVLFNFLNEDKLAPTCQIKYC